VRGAASQQDDQKRGTITAKAAGVTITLKMSRWERSSTRDYLKWTFSQDLYSYAPYRAQVTL
jgi:hypothetical protein